MKYKCYDCKQYFDFPKVVSECIGEYGSLPYFEEMGYCPHCMSDDWEKAEVVEEREEQDEMEGK